MYKIIINKSVLKSLDKIQTIYLLKIKETINQMAFEPLTKPTIHTTPQFQYASTPTFQISSIED